MSTLEGFTSAAGDELTQLFGFRSTRLTSTLAPASAVDEGFASATSIDLGVTVTFGVALNASVQVGDILRIVDDDFVVDSNTACSRYTARPANIVEVPATAGLARSFRAVGVSLSAGPTQRVVLDRDVIDAEHVGRTVHIYSTTTAANRGVFPIVARIDDRTFDITNAAGVAESGGSFAVEHEGAEAGDRLVLTAPPPTIDDIVSVIGTDAPRPNPRLRLEMQSALPLFTDEPYELHRSVREAVITAIGGGGLSVTLGGLGLRANFATRSFVVVRPAELDADVETTLGWTAPGTVFIDGVEYSFTALTLTKLFGLAWTDPVDAVYPGAKQSHLPRTEVVDFSRNFSSVDLGRRSLLVAVAEGPDLSEIGRRVSFPRAPLVDDETYRRLIQAAAYLPRGTLMSIRAILDVIFGAGNYTVFEDLTIGSVNHTCSVYFARSLATPAGKTFLNVTDIVPSTAAGTLTVDDPPATITVSSVKLAREPNPWAPMRVIYDGTARVSSGAPAGTVNFSAGIGTDVQVGDLLVLQSGPFNGMMVTVVDVTLLPLSCEVASVDGGPTTSPPEGCSLHLMRRRIIDAGQRGQRINPVTGTNFQRFDNVPFDVPAVLGARLEVLNAAGMPVESGFISSRPANAIVRCATGILPVTTPTAGVYVPWRITTDVVFRNERFQIWRPISNFRHYLPTVEKYVEAPGAAATTIWALNGAAIWTNTTTMENGPCLAGAALGLASFFQHDVRVDDDVAIRFSLRFGVIGSSVDTLATAGRQFALSVYDGAKQLPAGIIREIPPSDPASPLVAQARVGFVDAATGSFINQRATMTFAFGAAAVINTGDQFGVIDTRGKSTIFRFEKDTTVTVATELMQPIYIVTGDTNTQVRNKVTLAIRTAFAAQRPVAQVYPSPTGGASMILCQWFPGSRGNTTVSIVQTGAGITAGGNFVGGTGFDAANGTASFRPCVGLLDGTAGGSGSPEHATFEIERPAIQRDGTTLCVLRKNGVIVDVAPYSAFAAVVTDPRIEFGMAAGSGVYAEVLEADWSTTDQQERNNEHWTGATLTAPRTLFKIGAFPAGPAPVGKLGSKVRITRFDAASMNSSGGVPLGEFVVDTLSGFGASGTVIGVRQRRASFSPANRRRVRIEGDVLPFGWPMMKGWSLEILTGVNAGVFPITKFLNPTTGEDLDYVPGSATDVLAMSDTSAYVTSERDLVMRSMTNWLEVDTSALADIRVDGNPHGGGLFDGDEPEAEWRLVPVFPTGGVNVEFEFVNATSYAGGVVTKPIEPFTHPRLYEVQRTVLLSAQTLAEDETNDGSQSWPFYLSDAFGYVRRLIDQYTVAGVIADFDHLVVDDTGPHIME